MLLTASEMASLIGAGLDQRVRGELDSLEVTLGKGRIAVAGNIRTAGLPSDVLGPLAGALNAREPIQGAGPVEVTGPGQAVWDIDAFQVRDFDFPREMVPRIVGLLSGNKGTAGWRSSSRPAWAASGCIRTASRSILRAHSHDRASHPGHRRRSRRPRRPEAGAGIRGTRSPRGRLRAGRAHGLPGFPAASRLPRRQDGRPRRTRDAGPARDSIRRPPSS